MIDNMMKLLEQHTKHLEEVVKQRSLELQTEEKKVEALLCSIIPRLAHCSVRHDIAYVNAVFYITVESY